MDKNSKLYKETNEKFIGRMQNLLYNINGVDPERAQLILEECLRRNKEKMKNKKDNWISIKPTDKRVKEIWAKDKEGLRFYKQMKANAKKYTKILRPRICYTSDYDMFSMVWGDKPIDQTIETNLLHEGDLRFDITKDGTIVGLEIENFSEVLKKFNCDKEPFKSEIMKKIKKEKKHKIAFIGKIQPKRRKIRI